MFPKLESTQFKFCGTKALKTSNPAIRLGTKKWKVYLKPALKFNVFSCSRQFFSTNKTRGCFPVTPL